MCSLMMISDMLSKHVGAVKVLKKTKAYYLLMHSGKCKVINITTPNLNLQSMGVKFLSVPAK